MTAKRVVRRSSLLQYSFPQLRSLAALVGISLVLFACATNPTDEALSFFVAGHVHAWLADEFRREIPILNSHGLDFGVFTGDVVVDAASENWDAAARVLSSLAMPYHIAPGNHDLWQAGGERGAVYRGEQFSELFGGTYSSFSVGENLFLILDSVTGEMRARSNLEEQKIYFASILQQPERYRNIFVFMHYLLFVTAGSRYECLKGHIHWDKASDSPEHNIWRFIEDLVVEADGSRVYVFAGDLGVADHAGRLQIPAFFDRYRNVTIFAGGMGNPLQHYLIVRIKAAIVEVDMVPFNKSAKPMKAEDFGLQRYEFCR